MKDEQDQKMYVRCVKGFRGEKMHEQWVERSLGQKLHEQYVEESLGQEMHVGWRELWCMWGWRGTRPTDNLMGCSTLTIAMVGTS